MALALAEARRPPVQSQQSTGSGLRSSILRPLLHFGVLLHRIDPRPSTSNLQRLQRVDQSWIPNFRARTGGTMEHNLQNTIALLARTPAALDALLRGLPEVWTETNEGEGTWSVSTVVAHLIHAEHDDWMPRANVILHVGRVAAVSAIPARRLRALQAGQIAGASCSTTSRRCAHRISMLCARSI